jgi:cyclase
MRRLILSGTLLGCGVFAIALRAAQPLPEAALKATQIERVRDNLYVITGSDPTDRQAFSGGNTGVFITEKGVVLVDTKLAGWGQVILDKIRTVTDKPVIAIINTHTHGDHVGSNDAFPPPVEIIAHENTRANMERMDAFKGDKAKFLPNRTYKERMTFGAGRDQIDIYYFGAGHTSGDSFILYRALRVVQAGDMFAWKDAPFIDRKNGGSGLEFPKTLAKAVATFKGAAETVIPGHSPVMPFAALEEYQRFNAELLASVQEAVKAGKGLDEAVAAATAVPAKYPGYRSERVKAAVQAIYDELKP